ncbi:MAG: rhamnan synthesis F family protein [Luteimonas sp.]
MPLRGENAIPEDATVVPGESLSAGHAPGNQSGATLEAPPLFEIIKGGIAFDRQKDTILIVSHEASLSGAPILSLNLVRGFQQRYNVVVLLLGGGPLMEAFQAACVSMVQLIPAINAVQYTVAGIAERHQIKFAIANSVETSGVLETLAKRSIPSVVLIHEFAAYTRPRWNFLNAFFWSDEVVFSTRLTYDNVVAEYPQLSGRECRFIPQGRCVLLAEQADAASVEQETTRIRAALRPAGLAEDALVIIGIGFVQMRKGVELFIDCAARVVQAMGDRPCRFVWVGPGYDPEYDLGYSVYLADQVQRLGLQDHLHFMSHTFLIEEVYELADMFLLTSRLDPLPGVAIEAMSHALPVVCFDRTTGIADVLSEHGLAEECVVPYLDTHAMARQVMAFAQSAPLRQRVGLELKAIADDYFNMERYIQALDTLALGAVENVRREQAIAAEIHDTALARRDFLAPAQYPGDDVEVIRWKYVRPWTAGFDHVKPFPGFHPGIYDELQPQGTQPEPMTHYLRAGLPDGPWHHEVIASEDGALPIPENARVALHVHAYYPEFLPEILIRLGLNRLLPDLLLSVPSTSVMETAQALLQGYAGKSEIRVVPNRGRDIGPLLTAFGPQLLRDYDIVGHVHTKKTMDVADTAMIDRWRTFLVENMLGSKSAMVDLIVGRMANDPSIGLVFPDDPNFIGWRNNRPFAETLSARLGLPEDLPEHFVFPVGMMFWARVEALRPLFALELDWSDYPAEPLPYDGSMLHALERLIPFVAEQQGRRCVLTNVTGLTR